MHRNPIRVANGKQWQCYNEANQAYCKVNSAFTSIQIRVKLIGRATHVMAWENWGPERLGCTSKGVSKGNTSLAAMPTPYCPAIASPNSSTEITVGAV